MTTTKTLTIDLDERSYRIIIGSNLLNDNLALKQIFTPLKLGKQIAIISTPPIAKHYLGWLQQYFVDYECLPILLEDGEPFKNSQTLNTIYDQLMAHRFNRSCSLIALGGGVVGDITGFAAATWMRGVNFIQIPTSLLAQIDAAIGGKTGINHPQGKNMIGAFHQPRVVVIDTNTLKTLPHRQLTSGLAEVIKYGLIWDSNFLDFLEQNLKALLNLNQPALNQSIYRSCQIKAEIVSKDEREQSIRALLNFGHTFGHAIESLTHYSSWYHGEAISIGMVLASQLSYYQGYLSASDVRRVKNCFQSVGLPTELPANLTLEMMLNSMHRDKKSQDSGLPLILLSQLGKAIISRDYQAEHLNKVLAG